MFTLSSTATKLSVLAFSTLAAMGTVDSVVVGFQQQEVTVAVASLPTVTVVGRRTELPQDAAQVSLNSLHSDSHTVA